MGRVAGTTYLKTTTFRTLAELIKLTDRLMSYNIMVSLQTFQAAEIPLTWLQTFSRR